MILPALCMAASLAITACHTKAKNPSDPGITTASSNDSESQATKPVKRPALPTSQQEQALKDKLLAEAEGQIIQFVCQDFENTGSYQAFALIGEQTAENSGIYSGTVWYVSDKQVRQIGDDNFYTDLTARPVGAMTLVTTDRFFGNTTISCIYGVRDGDGYEDPISGQISGLNQLEDETFTIVQDTYDANMDGSGHTWKTYWLYWDDGFHEYGGIEIAPADLEKLDGAASVLEQIDQVKGKIVNILYRGNQVININYQTPWERYDEMDYSNNNYINLKYDNGTVTALPSDDNRGIYQEALIPSIAVYPESFPKS